MTTLTTAQRMVQAMTDAVIEELADRGLVLASIPTLGPDYDADTCATLARELGDNTLLASEVLYRRLSKKGEVGALELMKALVSIELPPSRSW